MDGRLPESSRLTSFVFKGLGLACALAIPCWLCSKEYQTFLASTVNSILALAGWRAEVYMLQMYAPLDVGVFVSLSAASSWATRRQRVRAVVVGIPMVILIELLSILLAAAPVLLLPNDGRMAVGAQRLMRYTMETSVWIGAFATWLTLLGGGLLRLNPPAMLAPAHKRGKTPVKPTRTVSASTEYEHGA